MMTDRGAATHAPFAHLLSPTDVARYRLTMAAAKRTGPHEHVRDACLRLPGAELKPFGGHTAPAYRVRDKLFVMTSEDGTFMTLKARPGVQQALVGDDPSRFFVPKYVGSKGWVGIRLDIDQDWDEIDELIEESYRMTAPKRLAAQIPFP
jgi:predicted DNA-binding protein (MmcQ/YjbR family)